MTFAWPAALVLLLVPPLLLGIYLWQRHRRRRFAVSYASLALIREALPSQSRWHRRIPLVLLLLALASLGIGAARPQTEVARPINRTSIILALDVSASMCSTDVAPNRLAAAQEVARTFVEDQPGGTRIGLVVFSGLAQILVPATTDHDALTEAIDALTVGRGTATGTALLRAIDAIAEVDPNVAPSGLDVGSDSGLPPDGQYQPDIIVVLTDGATTQGIDPLVAARQAAARGVRVYTIGFGTTDPAPLSCTRSQIENSFFDGRGLPRFGGNGGSGQQGSILDINDGVLQNIAEITGGSYHRTTDATQLLAVFRDLPSEIAITKERSEVSFVFAALGAVLAIASVGLSLVWNRYR